MNKKTLQPILEAFFTFLTNPRIIQTAKVFISYLCGKRMKMKSSKRNALLFSLLLCCAVLLFLLDLMFGSTPLPFDEIIKIITGASDSSSSYYRIFFKLRLPEAIAATAAGAALSVSGLSMQTLFRNPLADPSILGVSAGASLGVAIVTLVVGNSLNSFFGNSVTLLFSAFFGASLILFLMTILARRVSGTTLLLVGVIAGYTVGAITGILQFFATKEGLQTFIVWGMGSFKNIPMPRALLTMVASAVLLIITFFQSKGLNAFVMGEEYALNSGTNVKRLMVVNVLLSGALVAVITSFCGTIAFVGLMVPHFARMIFKAFDHRILIPASIVIGIALMLLCDLVASLPGTDHVLPVNAVTSIIGAPIVIFLILKRKK
ncbi:MAG: iron ABC transporter permease [Bacteroidales bacterium]|jgi:iron complex transport system permease protein|nr:iron ABC transporter permease [Bacteroidales bacterium]